MEIVCPQCTSRFVLPDDRVKQGVRLRCSVCKTVFALESPQTAVSAPPDAIEPFPKPDNVTAQERKPLPLRKLALSALVLVICLAGGIWLYNYNYDALLRAARECFGILRTYR